MQGDRIGEMEKMIKLEKILFPTDFSDFSGYAASFAVSFAMDYKATLYILHVIELPLGIPGIYTLGVSERELNQTTERLVREELEKASSRELLRSLKYEVACVKGKPFHEIIKFADETGIDMIVMGTRGRTGLESVLLGSTAEKVLRGASIPVFVVRRPGHRFVIPPVG
jgi:nucleotide-binding universal stress UspA family protein